ncbi:MAG: adenylate/guanylate cyclase domain-containing protein [Myxococcota bacterium]
MAARRAKIPFWTKLTLMGAGLVVGPVAVLGPLVLSEASATLERLNRELRISVAQDIATDIDASFREAEDALDGLGQTLANPALEPAAAGELALTLLGSSAAVDHAGVYDRTGRLDAVLREQDSEDDDLPETLPEALRTAAIDRNTATGEVSHGRFGIRVLLVVPVRFGDDVSGFVASRVPMRNAQAKVTRLAEGHYADLPDAVFVVDGSLRQIVHPDPEVAKELRDLREHPLFADIDPAVFSSPSAPAISAEYARSDAGEAMLGTIVPVTSRGWAVVAQVPESFAYGSVITVRRYLIATGLIAVALALAIAVSMARRISRPIKELSKFADNLAQRRFDSRITVATSDELAVLADVMSNAAADLEESEKRIQEEVEIRTDLGRYLPAELVDQVVKRQQDMALGGKRQQVTVLFADVVAFTPLTDKLAAEEVVTILNELFTILTEIVFRHGGTIDKFIGDCVMAIWGAPRSQADHAERALQAAQDMLQWLELGNELWRERHGVDIQLAIGIHSGEAVVGNIGSESRMEYTAIGDVVNVAARLESIARPNQILITKETMTLAGDGFSYRELGGRELSGRDTSVELLEVVS